MWIAVAVVVGVVISYLPMVLILVFSAALGLTAIWGACIGYAGANRCDDWVSPIIGAALVSIPLIILASIWFRYLFVTVEIK